MPMRPLPPCSFPGCPARATMRGRCANHQRPIIRKADNRPSASERGYGYDWQRTSAAYLKAHPNCASCGNTGNQVDHIIPRNRGGTDGYDNLQTLCPSCHSRKTARLDGGFGNKRRAYARR